MTARFVQIHTLTAYPAALLNRDDVGFAKRITFGGAVRTRISSQCLKRHWRTFEGKGAIAEVGLPSTVRSRRIFEDLIVQPLVEEGYDHATVALAASAVRDMVLGGNQEKTTARQKKKAGDDGSIPEVLTGQVTVLGRPEVNFLRELTRRIADAGSDEKSTKDAAKKLFDKAQQANLKALKHASGVGAALFGRMVTSDLLSRGDAAIHVAHAMTVHGEETETDYFSAVDDLTRADGELGSGHIGNTELTSGLYYSYVVVDVPLLVANLTGVDAARWLDVDRELAAQVVARLVRVMSTVSPGAKLGSTAPYAHSLAVLVEVGDAQPRTLANAFLQPVRPRLRDGSIDVLAGCYGQLGDHVSAMDRMYGDVPHRRMMGLRTSTALLEQLSAHEGGSLTSLSDWLAARIREGA